MSYQTAYLLILGVLVAIVGWRTVVEVEEARKRFTVLEAHLFHVEHLLRNVLDAPLAATEAPPPAPTVFQGYQDPAKFQEAQKAHTTDFHAKADILAKLAADLHERVRAHHEAVEGLEKTMAKERDRRLSTHGPHGPVK